MLGKRRMNVYDSVGYVYVSAYVRCEEYGPHVDNPRNIYWKYMHTYTHAHDQ